MEASADNNCVASFAGLWSESLAVVLGQIAAKPFPVRVAENGGERTEGGAEDSYLNVTARGPVRGELVLRLPAATGVVLARLFVGDEKQDGAMSQEDRAALEELFRQVAGYVCTSAKGGLSGLQLTVTSGTAPTWAPASSGWLESAPDAAKAIALEWRVSPALHTALRGIETPARIPDGVSADPVAPQPGTLDMFMQLELEVSIRFGSRTLPLKEVLELGPGSVLELDREVNDPADLVLDGKVIAKGSVVMVDGYFGMKVTQVLSVPQLV